MAKVLGFTIQIQGTERAVETAEELRRTIAEVQKALKKASSVNEIKNLESKLIDLKARQSEVNAEVREQVKARQDELKATNAVEGGYSRLSRSLNLARKQYKDLAAAGQENTKEAQALVTQIKALDQQLKNIDASVGQYQRNVGNYSSAFDGLAPALQNIGRGFGDITNAVGKGAKAAAIITLAFEAFRLISETINAATEAGKEFIDTAGLIQQRFGLAGDALKDSTGTVIALARTYQQESRDIINSANTLSKELGTSFEDSLTLIEAGFRKGANAQGDFLDQLREYPAQFAAAGGNAQQFIDILIKAQQEGIYSDKGIDAVKEFGLRIREQTVATRGALENAFGKKFTDDLFKGINNGSITTVDALKRVGKGLQDTGLTAEQTQRVIADTFGGPGEDAGLRFLQLLGDIDDATQGVTESTTEYQTQQEKVFAANQDLAQAQADLALELTNTGTEFGILQVKAKTFLLDAAVKLLRFFDRLPVVVNDAKTALSALAATLTGNFKRATQIIADGAIERQVLLDRIAAENVASQAEAEAAAQKKAEEEAKAKAKARGKAVGEKFIEGSVAAIQQRKGELEKAIARAISGSDAQAVLIRELQVVEDQLEKAVEDQNRVRLEASRKADLERVGQIQQLGTLILTAQVNQEKKTTDAIIDVLKDRNAKRHEIEQQQAEADAQAQEDQRQNLRESLEDFAATSFYALEAFAQAANERRNAIFAEQIASTENRIAELEQRAAATTGFRKRIFEQSIAQEKKLLEQQRLNAEAEQKKQAKAEKRLASIQAIIFGALAFQKALASSLPPVNFINAAAVAIATAAQLATINAQPLAKGGVVGISGRRVTDRQNMPARSNGDNVLATVKRGEVVLNQRQQSALGGARTFKQIGVPGFASGGPVGVPITAPRLPGSENALAAIEALDRKTDAINARLDRLRAYVVTDDIIQDISENDSIKVKASL
ncbi:MAG: hypothetical protein IPN20_04325 [Haliscomenobacter sp.]|nr:hypothetical protein [Haliscomenobacter sp.]